MAWRIFVAALRYDRIETPWLLDDPINAVQLRFFVEKVLGPTLHPDDLVIMDDLCSHKSPAIRQAIRAAGGNCSCCGSSAAAPSENITMEPCGCGFRVDASSNCLPNGVDVDRHYFLESSGSDRRPGDVALATASEPANKS